jgi:phytoene dehydrogenase-like protein
LASLSNSAAIWPTGVDESYRSWATREFDADFAKLAIGFAALPTYHPDPGELSAAFVQNRIARSSEWRPVWYVAGGWIKLVDKLTARAEELGVEIITRSKLSELPNGLCVVATDIPAAAKLLGDPDLDSPGPDNALLDVSVRRRRGDPTAVLDLDRHTYVSSFSAGDATVPPKGEWLLQAVTGIRVGEEPDSAQSRIEAVLNASYKGWRDRVVWQRKGITRNTVGPCDMPGTTWRDRPSIDRGRDRWLIGGHVAAPGVLAETCFESAKAAAATVLAKLG